MASLTKINGTYHVRVRRKGHKTQCASFKRKADAELWAADVERRLKLGTLIEDDIRLAGHQASTRPPRLSLLTWQRLR
jgi:hypothetical protein